MTARVGSTASLLAGPIQVHRHGVSEKVVVGLHGWSGSHRSFDPLLPHRPEPVSLWVFDQPGYGCSAPPRSWDLPTLVETMDPVLPQRPVTLLGFSAGATLGMYWAHRWPERVERLVLLDPFAFVPWYFGVFTAGWVGSLLYYLVFANPVGRWLTNLGLRKHRTTYPDMIEGFRTVQHVHNLSYLRCLSGAVAHLPTRLAYEGPVDVLYGERTFDAVRRSLPLWRTFMPQVRCVEIPGAGHLPMHEAPETVARWVFRPECS